MPENQSSFWWNPAIQIATQACESFVTTNVSSFRWSKTLRQAFYSVVVSVKDRSVCISCTNRSCNYLIAHCKNKLVVSTTECYLGCRLAWEMVFFLCVELYKTTWEAAPQFHHTTTTHWEPSEHLWGNHLLVLTVWKYICNDSFTDVLRVISLF